MNRTEFIVVIAIILFVAFALGWFANWLVHRLTRVSGVPRAGVEKEIRLLKLSSPLPRFIYCATGPRPWVG